ncbi:MAG: Gldg family protein [Kiritimatiellae bacterium]|nr:Gldg family protein [Kiritimatiellia bacterium]
MTNQPRGGRLLGSSLAAFVVVAAIVVAVNVILGGVVWRLDLTEDRIYTLSEGTRAVLRELDGPVTLKFFFNASDPQVPPHLRVYARAVSDLLREYEIEGRGKIVVETYDPVPDSDAADWARRYGIEPQPAGFFGPEVMFGLVAAKGDAEAVIPYLNPEDQERLEYDITRLIARLSKPKKPVVGLISSLPLLGGLGGMPFGPQPQRGWFAFTDLEKDYTVRQISETAETLEDDLEMLVIVHPKNLSEKLLYAIDQYLLRGGKILAFLDPLCLAEDQSRGPMGMMNFGAEGSTLGPLLGAWGVTWENSRVLADLEAATLLRSRDGRAVNNPMWLSLRPANMADDRLTAKIETLLMPTPGAFKVEPPEGVEARPLIRSSEAAGFVDSMTARFGESVGREFQPGRRREVLAVRLSGTFSTAFPKGEPGGDTNTTSTTSAPTNAVANTAITNEAAASATTNVAPTTAGAGHLGKSREPGLVVLVADADLLYDHFCLREVRLFGQTAYTPMNDNLTFFFGAVEELLGGARLAQIRSRGRMERPFEVVVALLRAAQERHLAEERALEQKLEETKRRLEELQAQKGNRQDLVLTPEQKVEIERFRREELETSRKLKEVRKNLRADIERLGAVVKAVNILGMPLLVGLGGIGFGLWRRSRR